MGRIPDRWLDYKPVGHCIAGTRFICFKVPLRENVNKQVDDPSLRLDCKSLMHSIPNLGMVIDLTNTKRFYDPSEFIENGIIHYKMLVPGHVTPAPKLFNEFVECVQSFLNDNKDNNKLIGVHCTHGVNRTGYFICKYMVTHMNFSPSDALDNFACARGHKIERSNYITAIRYSRSNRDAKVPDSTTDLSEEPASQITSWRHSFDHTSYDGHNGGMRRRPSPYQAQREPTKPAKNLPFHQDPNGWYVMGEAGDESNRATNGTGGYPSKRGAYRGRYNSEYTGNRQGDTGTWREQRGGYGDRSTWRDRSGEADHSNAGNYSLPRGGRAFQNRGGGRGGFNGGNPVENRYANRGVESDVNVPNTNGYRSGYSKGPVDKYANGNVGGGRFRGNADRHYETSYNRGGIRPTQGNWRSKTEFDTSHEIDRGNWNASQGDYSRGGYRRRNGRQTVTEQW